MIKCVCNIFFIFREWCKREGRNYIFALKENSVYNNPLSNTGCYEHIRPSLPSPACLFAEAACSSEPAQQALTLPTGIPALHWRCGLSLSPGPPLLCTNKTASQQRGLVNLGSGISSKDGFRLQSRSPE